MNSKDDLMREVDAHIKEQDRQLRGGEALFNIKEPNTATKFVPDLLGSIPPEVIEAERVISEFFDRDCDGHWAFGGIQKRAASPQLPVAQMSGDDLPAPPSEWRLRWYGSPPMKGWSIMADRHTDIAYFGDAVEESKLRAIVTRHNEEIARLRMDASHPSNAVQDARQPWRNQMPCDHIYKAVPIDGSNRANVPCKAVCMHCGFEPAATVPQVVQAPSAMVDELLRIARLIEALKKPCGDDPESPQAIRNGQYQSIALMVRALAAAPQPVAASPSIVPSDEQIRADFEIWHRREMPGLYKTAYDRNAAGDYTDQLTQDDWKRYEHGRKITTASNAGEAAPAAIDVQNEAYVLAQIKDECSRCSIEDVARKLFVARSRVADLEIQAAEGKRAAIDVRDAAIPDVTSVLNSIEVALEELDRNGALPFSLEEHLEAIRTLQSPPQTGKESQS